MTNQRKLAFWTTLVVLVVSGLMFVAAQTARTQTGGPAAQNAQSAEPAAPTDPNAVVFRLGDEEVTAAEFEPRFNIALRGLAAQQGAPLDAATLAQFSSLRPNFLDQFATQQVLLQDAAARGVTVPGTEVEAQLAQAREGAGENFEQALRQAGYEDEAALRTSIRESLILQREVAALRSEVTVSPDSVRQFYDQNRAQFGTPEQVCARHILLEDKARADELFIQLQDGGNFAEVARNNSTDTGSGQQGGDLGCFGRGQMVGPFEEAAFGAEVGDTVGPVQSEFGYHIIRVYEKNPAVTTPFPEVREQVREQLVNQQLGTRITALREASGAELFPENLPTTAPAAPEPPSGTGSAEPAQPAAEPAAEPAAPVEGESEGESDH